MPTVVLILFLIFPEAEIPICPSSRGISKHSSSFFDLFVSFSRFFDGTHTQRGVISQLHSGLLQPHSICAVPSCFTPPDPVAGWVSVQSFEVFPGPSGATFVPEKGLATMLFFRNLLWMFIPFHKQVSVIKIYRLPSTLLLLLFLLNLFPFFFQVSISFYKSCDILCIFKQLIRVLLCFYSRDYVLLSSMLLLFSSLLFEKELLPKETFFVTRNYGDDTVCATHDARLCHVCSITTRKRKRRSWANFRRRYITRKLIFPAYILDLGLANDIYLIKIGHM